MNKKKLLICEDDESILDILHMVFAQSGFTTVLSTSCVEMNALVEREKPDLVILDRWMPGKNGDIALQQLRQMPANKDLPVIMLSASHDGADVAKAAGANAFVAKPFNVTELVETVRKLVN